MWSQRAVVVWDGQMSWADLSGREEKPDRERSRSPTARPEWKWNKDGAAVETLDLEWQAF